MPTRVDANFLVQPGYDDFPVERKQGPQAAVPTDPPPTDKVGKNERANRPDLPPPGAVGQKDFTAAANSLADSDQVSLTQLLSLFLKTASLEQKSSALTRQALLQDQLDQTEKAAEQIKDQAAMQLAAGIAGGVASFASAGISGYGAGKDAADATQTIPLRQQSAGLGDEMQMYSKDISTLKSEQRNLEEQDLDRQAQLSALKEQDAKLAAKDPADPKRENISMHMRRIEAERAEIAELRSDGSADLENRQLELQRTQLKRDDMRDELATIHERGQLRSNRLGAANQIVQGVGKSTSAGFDYAGTQKQADEKLTEQLAARYGEQADDAKSYRADANAFWTNTLQLLGGIIQARAQADITVATMK